MLHQYVSNQELIPQYVLNVLRLPIFSAHIFFLAVLASSQTIFMPLRGIMRVNSCQKKAIGEIKSLQK